MEQRRVKPYSKDEAMSYAKSVLQSKRNCNIKKISYIGGGSYGYVYLCDNNKLSKDVLLVMEKSWDNFDQIFSEPVENAVLIHGDLNTMNIMADKHLNPTAIIDPLESKWADKEYDLFQLRNLNGDMYNLYETYKRKFSVSEKCDIKCAFYVLYNEIYCNITAGSFNAFLIKPVVKRMKKELAKAGL